MKKFIYFITLLFLSTNIFAQEGEKMGIKLGEFEALKKIAIKNLDKDTYVKDGNFVLDNSTSPYVFKFSDGLERRIYLYKVLESAGMKEIANLMIFTTPKDGKRISLVVPNPLAEKETWGKYIDDLKDGEKAVSGFSSCVAFVLAKEFSGVSGEKGKEEDKYEYCFPAEAKVTMATGEIKNINEVKAGDYVISYNTTLQKAEPTIVEKVEIHENNSYDIVKVFLVDPNEMITASVAVKYKLKELEATANHPIYTENGKTTMGNLKVGQTVFVYDIEMKKFKKFNVFLTKAGARKVNKVYNLITEKNSYLINSVVVLKK